MSDFKRTKAAILKWERTRPERDREWNAVQTDADVDRCQALDERARLLVGAAFYEETKDINRPWVAQLVHPADPWLRRLAGLPETIPAR